MKLKSMLENFKKTYKKSTFTSQEKTLEFGITGDDVNEL